MESGGAVTVSVQVVSASPAPGAPAPTAAPGAPRLDGPGITTTGAPAGPTTPTLARTGVDVPVLVALALLLILIGTVVLTAARTRLEHSHA